MENNLVYVRKSQATLFAQFKIWGRECQKNRAGE